MHIKLTPEQAAERVTVNATVPVHSYGNVYQARVAEVKGNRARCVWTNKSGVKYDNWITIPGRTQAELNPHAAATRKLRADATRDIKHAESCDRRAAQKDEDAERYRKLQALLAERGLEALQAEVRKGHEADRSGWTSDRMIVDDWKSNDTWVPLTLEQVRAKLEGYLLWAVKGAESERRGAQAARERAAERRAKAAELDANK